MATVEEEEQQLAQLPYDESVETTPLQFERAVVLKVVRIASRCCKVVVSLNANAPYRPTNERDLTDDEIQIGVANGWLRVERIAPPLLFELVLWLGEEIVPQLGARIGRTRGCWEKVREATEAEDDDSQCRALAAAFTLLHGRRVSADSIRVSELTAQREAAVRRLDEARAEIKSYIDELKVNAHPQSIRDAGRYVAAEQAERDLEPSRKRRRV